MTVPWADISVKEHKNIKGLKNQNLRDHMNEAELMSPFGDQKSLAFRRREDIMKLL
ncbi:hypothetical protein [Rickettsia sp. MEAM1 (Bemisia tabaci)]|uniref:hypothetical protein n=1 Tax=Rickettsia sp. MEAM1 (Bemisia tabaci) TaxID=1182263 RepID=UPI0012FE6855|nr:hypothetical protein [Rickettsia sp. MEAM1 (Bemisia tabaci)]